MQSGPFTLLHSYSTVSEAAEAGCPEWRKEEAFGAVSKRNSLNVRFQESFTPTYIVKFNICLAFTMCQVVSMHYTNINGSLLQQPQEAEV